MVVVQSRHGPSWQRTFLATTLVAVFIGDRAAGTVAPGIPASLPVEIPFASLSSRAFEVRATLATEGILVVPGIPGYAVARRDALQAALTCLQSGTAPQSAVIRQLPDGSERRTIASMTSGGDSVPLEVPGCPEFAASGNSLRALVHMAVVQVTRLWQPTLWHGSSERLGDTMLQAEHLEHFHVYEAPKIQDDAEPDEAPPAVALHTDAGLLLAFAPPLYTDDSETSSGLFVQEPDGSMRLMHAPQDSLVFLVGESARWLPSGGRPVPHALKLPRGSERAWFGHMVRLPEDMVLPSHSGAGSNLQATYGQWWTNATTKPAAVDVPAPIGCGSVNLAAEHGGSSSSPVDLAGSCDEGEVFCWMACMQVPEECEAEGAHCSNTATGQEWHPEDGHCLGCTATCPDRTFDGFCDRAAASDMIMTGFTVYGISGQPKGPCVMLFFSDCVLDTAYKFWFGTFCCFLLGMAVEGVSSVKLPSGRHGRLFRPLLYGLRITLAYLVMLAAMTFSVEIFFAVVTGLAVGNAVFKCSEEVNSGLSGPSPCCSHGGVVEAAEMPSSRGGYAAPLLDENNLAVVQLLKVDGMTCRSCADTVCGAIRSVKGVCDVHVTLENGGRVQVVSEFAAQLNTVALIDAVEAVGFDAQAVQGP